MNILDMMNKLTALSQPIVEAKEEKTTHKGGTVTSDEKGSKHKGKYGTAFQGDEDDEKTDDYGKKKKAKKAVEPAEKRGRGRPVKPENKAAKDKPDWSGFGAKKDVKLKPWDKKKTTKHSLKDWIEHAEASLNEASTLTQGPLPAGGASFKNAQGQTVAQTTNQQATQAVASGSVNVADPSKPGQLKEVEKNHMGETEYHGYYKWKVACRKAGAVEFVGDRDIDEGHDSRGKAVGEWDGVVGSVYGDAHKQKPAVGQMAEAGESPEDIVRQSRKASRDADDDMWAASRGKGQGANDLAATARKNKQDAGSDRWAATQGNSRMAEGKKAKPDFLDKDKDGNKKEPFKKAVKDAKKKPVKEGQLNELSPKTLASYVKKASDSRTRNAGSDAYDIGYSDASPEEKGPYITGRLKSLRHSPEYRQSAAKNVRRGQGINKAVDRLSWEADPTIDEGSEQGVTVYGNRQGYYAWTPNSGVLALTSGISGPIRTQTYWKNTKGTDPQIQQYVSKAMKPVEFSELPRQAQRIISRHLLGQGVAEGRMKDLSMDLGNKKDSLPDAEFKKKYGKSKADMTKDTKQDPKKPVSKIKESIIRESHDTMKHIISKFKHEVKNFVAGEELDQDLYDALYDYYCDMGEMPYGTMKARDGDPFEWVMQRFDRDVQEHDVPVDESLNEPHPVDVPAYMRQMQGKGGESRFPLTLDQVNANDSLSHGPNLKAAGDRLATASPWDAAPVANVQFEGWEKELDSLLSEGMNVTANTGLGDGPDSVTISATDEDAQHLLAIVKSAGLGMFAGDTQADPEGSPQMSIQSQNNPEADIEVVDDHDDMLGLIRKMTGQGGQPGTAEVEVDEGGCQACESGSCQEHGQQVTDETETPDQAEAMAAENTPTFGAPEAEGSSEEEVAQATEKLEKVHDAWSEAGEGETEPVADTGEEEAEEPAEEEGEEAEEPAEEEGEEEEEKEEVTEWANDAGGNLEDETFESDIDFMQNVITGGLNGRKRTQSVGSPVTVASTPMKESTDLLKDWVKLSGL